MVFNLNKLHYIGTKTSVWLNCKSLTTKSPSVITIQKNDFTDNEKYFKRKFENFMSWYEHFIGLDEVRICQDRVITAQERLTDIQEERRQTSKELSTLSKKKSEITDELIKTNKEDSRYLALITEEHRVLQQEREIKETLNNQERQERDYFTFLSNAVRDSHEKQRMQAEKTKYWGLILSICSSVLAWSVADWKHKRILREFIANINKDSPKNIQLIPVLEKLDETSKELLMIKNIISNVMPSENIEKLRLKINELELNHKDLITHLNKNFVTMERIISNNKEDVKKIIKSTPSPRNTVLQHSDPVPDFENVLSKYQNEIFCGVVTCAVTYLLLFWIKG